MVFRTAEANPGRSGHARWRMVLTIALLGWLGWSISAQADLVELLSGAKLEGSVTKIDKEAREVTVATQMGGRTYTRVYPYDRIHAVTLGDKRYVLNEMPDAGPTGSRPKPASGSTSAVKPTGGGDIAKRIEQQGVTPPDWYDSTPLNYPRTLDLSWPEPPPDKAWNNQKNMGQYIWDIINPNPAKWREGTKLLHHMLEVNKDRPETLRRIMDALGRFYHNLLQDDARAAFWWQKAGVGEPDTRFRNSAPLLAECYYRLGSKPMASQLLMQVEKTAPQFSLIKVWADMGELARALQLAEAYARGNASVAAIAYMYAGDACRTNGDYAKAMDYYQKVIGAQASGQLAKRIEREQQRARDSLEAIRLFERADPARVPDGVYEANSMGYASLIHVAVTVQGGRIQAIQITRHEEKQFYSAFTDTVQKIIQRQSVKGVDATSSATLTSEAVINAVAKALAGAARPPTR